MSLPEFLSELSIRQSMAMAGYTVLTYDYFLTLNLEIDYIWNTPWSTVKAIFLINRYGTLIGLSAFALEELGLLSHGSAGFCASFEWFQSLLLLLSAEAIRVLHLLRAWTLWKCSYPVAISLVAAYVLYVLIFSGRIFYVMLKYSANFDFRHLDETEVCFLYPPASCAWLLGLLSFLLDTAVFAVITYYLYELCRRSQDLKQSPLLRLLVRDAAFFYMANVFHDMLVVLSTTIFQHDPRNNIHIGLSFPLLVVAGQRAILNLRSFQTAACTTQGISLVVDRQLAALRQRSFWQSVDLWMNDIHHEVELHEELTQCRTTRTRSQVMEEGRPYGLEVIQNHIESRLGCKSAVLGHAAYDSPLSLANIDSPCRSFREVEDITRPSGIIQRLEHQPAPL